MLRPTPRRVPTRALTALAVVAALGAGGFVWYRSLPRPEVVTAGPEDGAMLDAEATAALALSARTDLEGALDDATLVVDGDDVTASVERTGSSIRWQPEQVLEDGDHEAVLTVPARFPVPTSEHRWTFATDATAPTLELTDTEVVAVADEALELTGTVEGAARVRVGDRDVEVADDGSFTVAFDEPPAARVDVRAVDAAGNATEESVGLTTVPSRVMVDDIRGVHVSFWAWATPSLRNAVLALAREGRINTVQLDLKDESGVVGYDSEVPRAQEIGSDEPIYDLDDAVRQLHDLDIHVMGRIVAFRDGVLATHAWGSGQRDQVVQTAGGDIYTGRYEGFGNVAHPAVRQYNIDVAEEAVRRGVDGILWDYVRKPDGDMSRLSFPGLETDGGAERAAEEAVVGFVREAEERLAPYEIVHGASVYGIAATRPHEIAQNIPEMAEHLDIVSPMVYPTHWAPGEYDVADPLQARDDITERSLVDFVEAVEGTAAKVVPWLEDSPYRTSDIAGSVRDQLAGAGRAGIDEWLMWDPAVTYTTGAYPVRDEG